jgi:oligopeptide/dipeptide ABC transporter ATP-binding protein
MHAGQTVEWAPVRALFRAPAHPYTRALLRSIPRVVGAGEMEPIPGGVPSLLTPPPGCRFASRCALVRTECAATVPVRSLDGDHRVACVAVEASS